MTRIATNGHDIAVDEDPWDATNQTRDTSVFRSGIASFKMDSTAGNVAATAHAPASGSGSALNASRTYFYRGYLRFVTLPSSNVIVLKYMATLAGTTGISARLNTDGTVNLVRNDTAAVIGSASTALSTAVWYRFEINAVLNGSSQITSCELRIDGTTVASTSGLTLATTNDISVGWIAAPGANRVMNLDDSAIQDSTGAVNNSWPGSGKVALMLPKSDTQVGSWTGGVGGTTNLFDAINNTPPIGTATETNLTQIESADSSGNNATDEYRGNCGTYFAAGIGPHDVITAIRLMINSGEDIVTGTKTGSLGAFSNPVIALTAFTFGADAGALGTYPTTWWWDSLTSEFPTVACDSNLIIQLRKTDATTRVGSVDFFGAYVDYIPAFKRNQVNPSRFVPINRAITR